MQNAPTSKSNKHRTTHTKNSNHTKPPSQAQTHTPPHTQPHTKQTGMVRTSHSTTSDGKNKAYLQISCKLLCNATKNAKKWFLNGNDWKLSADVCVQSNTPKVMQKNAN